MKRPLSVSRSTAWINLWLVLAFFLLAAACLEAWGQIAMFGSARENLNALCKSIRAEYEKGGAQQLAKASTNMGAMGPRIHLVNRQGIDLADGTDQSALLRVRHGFWPFGSGPPPAVVVTDTPNLSCVLEPPPGGRRNPPGSGLWTLPLVSLLCCAVAGYVTLRSRRLEGALAAFGGGLLGARVASSSRDPLGRVSQRFNEMAERIELLVHAQQRLCIDVSHELRSPLARLTLATRLARDGAPGALDLVERETGRLAELVDHLLEIARAEADPQSIEREPLDIPSLITEIADHCQIEAEEKGCSIATTLDRGLAIEGDRELLRRAIENILRNAIRYSPVGSIVQVSAHGAKAQVIVQVRDFGPGVPEEALDQVFEPFYRVGLDRDRETGGTGLGLAITKRAIALHGGTVHALNQSPGLLVKISLPLFAGDVKNSCPSCSQSITSHS